MNRNESGSATLHSLFAAVLLLTALAAAMLWSTVSTARHKLAAAADLTALSAAQSLNDQPAAALQHAPTRQPATFTQSAAFTPSPTAAHPGALSVPPSDPCATAARIATLHKVNLTACTSTPTSVTVQVAIRLDIAFAHPTLTATSRAGPV